MKLSYLYIELLSCSSLFSKECLTIQATHSNDVFIQNCQRTHVFIFKKVLIYINYHLSFKIKALVYIIP